MHETVLVATIYYIYIHFMHIYIYIGIHGSELNMSHTPTSRNGVVVSSPAVRPMHLRSEQAWGLESWTMGVGTMK